MVAVAAPEREQRGREAGVADRADVGAAVGEADDGVRVGEHLADRVEVAVAVVEERHVEERRGRRRRAAGRRRGRAGRGLRARRGAAMLVSADRARSRAGRRARTCGRSPAGCVPPLRASFASAASTGRGTRGRAARPTCSASGRPAISRYTGLASNGCSVHCRPSSSPTGRGATWPVIVHAVGVGLRRAARAARRQLSLARLRAARTTAAGPTPRPCAGRSRTRRRRRRSRRPPAARPARCAPIASAMPTSSSASAVSVGVNSPRLVRWLSVRDVVKPSAPASMPSAASAAIGAMSSGVAGSRRAPRSPITCSRSAPCGTCSATSTSNGRPSSASRNSGNDCQFHAGPRAARRRGCPRRLPSAR